MCSTRSGQQPAGILAGLPALGLALSGLAWRRSSVQLCAALLLCLSARQGIAGLRAFEFGGRVSSPGMAYGISVPAGAEVRGRFVYATGLPATHNFSADSKYYLQEMPGAFRMELGALSIVANSFVAGVGNDFDTNDDGEPNADFFSIIFDLNFPPPKVTYPFYAEGVARNSGAFNLSWAYDVETFAGTTLPEVLPAAGFSSAFNAFLLSSPGVPTVFFEVTSLEAITLVPGDFDFDGEVTPNDHGAWVSEFGGTGPSLADGNGDGVVDAADYTLWRDLLGGAPAQSLLENGQATQVPEPAGLLQLAGGLLGVGILALKALRRRARVNGLILPWIWD